MAWRIPDEGLVTVSLRKSIILLIERMVLGLAEVDIEG